MFHLFSNPLLGPLYLYILQPGPSITRQNGVTNSFSCISLFKNIFGLRCLILATAGYRKGNVYDMDSFSRNNYVIVGSRTLHCEPPQVYQPTPDPPPPGRKTFDDTDIVPNKHISLSQPCVLNKSDSVCVLPSPSCMEPSFRPPRSSFCPPDPHFVPPILFSNLSLTRTSTS